MCKLMEHPVEEEYADGLAKEKAESRSEDARDNILRFYNDNKVICDKAYQYYTEYDDNKTKYVNEPIHLAVAEFLKRLKPKKILILTANPIERAVLIRWLSEKNGSPLEAYMVGCYSYNIYDVQDQDTGEAKEVSIIHLDPGKTGDESTRSAINSTCKLFRPDCIISLGICYGFDKSKYTIGNVFISDSVTVFRVNFRDTENETIGLEPEIEFEMQPAHNLGQLIRERIMYTMTPNILSGKKKPLYARPYLGKFLSINGLMSNKTAKQALIKQYDTIKPKPLGGEMEGAGILKSDIVKENGFRNWLIVKSICDWGEMKNNLDSDADKSERIKDTLQAFAMTNTCGIFNKILADLCEVQYG